MLIKGPWARVLWLRRPHRHPLSCCSRDGRSLRYVPTCRMYFAYSGCPRVYGTATVTACEQDRGRAAVGRAICRDHTDCSGGRRVGWLF